MATAKAGADALMIQKINMMRELSFEQMENLHGGSWGQRTMDCITDAYSNYGWASVAAWVGTAFQPEIALVFAGVCAYATY